MFVFLTYVSIGLVFQVLIDKNFVKNKLKKLSLVTLCGLSYFIMSFFYSMPRVLSVGVVMLSAVIVAVINYRQLSMWVLSLSVACNLVAMSVNGGSMPVDSSFLEIVSLGPEHVFTNDQTKVWWLADIFHFPYAGMVFSVGDVLLILATWLLFFEFLRFNREQKN